MKPGNSAAEKELSQLHQSQDALNTATNLFDSGDFSKSLDYVDKVVLVFSPACSKVIIKIILLLIYCCPFILVLVFFKLSTQLMHFVPLLQAKLLKVKLLLAAKDYSGAISETGYILKEDESNLEALLLRGRAYYYLADHDVAIRFVQEHHLT